MRKILFLVLVSIGAVATAAENDKVNNDETQFYGALKVGYAKVESLGVDFDPGVSLGINAGIIVDDRMSLGIDVNYIDLNSKQGSTDLYVLPVLADLSFNFNNDGVAKFYAGVLAGATLSKTSGVSERWDFTVGGKVGARFDVNNWLTISPELYGNNVFLGGDDYQIWGAQALFGMRF